MYKRQLLDSAHLQEEDARRANRYGFSRHAKALPLYTRADAQRALAQMVPLNPGQETQIGRHRLRLSPVGHLLGACAVHLTEPGRQGLQLVFSGDVGRQHDLLMPPPQPLKQADVLIVESTYGNRDHPDEDPLHRLADVVKHTVQRGGSVLMPAFAVGRAQALLILLQRLRRAGRLDPRIPIFLDSPMAIEATALYRRHARLLAVPAGEMRGLCDGVRMVTTLQQSQRLSASRYPAIIISASGMATGGRVLGHLKAMAPEPRHTLLFAGFQVGGSRGARLLAGERAVKIFGEMVPVRADVQQLAGISGHADRHELLAWLRHIRQPPQQTFVVHGEPDASDTLRSAIRNELGWSARVPAHGECAEL